MKIVLASGSERRQELLKRIVEDFIIKVSDFDEASIIYKGDPKEYVEELSKGKGEAVSKEVSPDSIIISADTIVVYEKEILLKPKDSEDAFKMLKMLSGKTHKVYTGVTVLNNRTLKSITKSFITEVKFSKLDESDIIKYIESKDPLDKAGAYGIQGNAAVFVEGISGCYYNVVGLPLNGLSKMLKEILK
ncbi:MAG: Maf-like protein [Clostridium sp.]|uniref:Maf-like protein n=1 Tax=Clostridium sp. LY3-2 TaxID=2942482 RepID=UPI00215262E3|nr:Maf-like protein [Clostridium sp. LY3-2]MCR6514204.1 Maf-like protein [Clostridium sp. LY3-2]